MHYADLAVIVVYLIAITWFGARFRKTQRTLKDYFLGGHTAPWWAISLSIVSAETSTLTVIGTPALAFTGNFGFLQLVFGYLLARVVISALFLHALSGRRGTGPVAERAAARVGRREGRPIRQPREPDPQVDRDVEPHAHRVTTAESSPESS